MTGPSNTLLLIVGWSARAAAQSAARAGLTVQSLDAFLDVDLQRTATACGRLNAFEDPESLTSWLAPSDWMYTGGAENHPAFVAGMPSSFRLLGTDAPTLRRVRDPFELQRVAQRRGLAFPQTVATVDETSGDVEWLLKSLRSGGGRGVEKFAPAAAVPRDRYLQRFTAGTAFGASYVAAGGRCRLLGVCKQLSATHDRESSFLYGGSLGPYPLTDALQRQFEELGTALAEEFPLRGLFGCDAIVDDAGKAWLLEVNPRYTASMELLERASGASVVGLHRAACLEPATLDRLAPAIAPRNQGTLFGKRIVYHAGPTPRTIDARRSDRLLAAVGESEFPLVADVPAAGTVVNPHEPLCTVLAEAATERDVLRELDRIAGRVGELLELGSP
jgi:predicted ATP-grasp superfamily ATP-dependent carboligase